MMEWEEERKSLLQKQNELQKVIESLQNEVLELRNLEKINIKQENNNTTEEFHNSEPSLTNSSNNKSFFPLNLENLLEPEEIPKFMASHPLFISDPLEIETLSQISQVSQISSKSNKNSSRTSRRDFTWRRKNIPSQYFFNVSPESRKEDKIFRDMMDDIYKIGLVSCILGKNIEYLWESDFKKPEIAKNTITFEQKDNLERISIHILDIVETLLKNMNNFRKIRIIDQVLDSTSKENKLEAEETKVFKQNNDLNEEIKSFEEIQFENEIKQKTGHDLGGKLKHNVSGKRKSLKTNSSINVKLQAPLSSIRSTSTDSLPSTSILDVSTENISTSGGVQQKMNKQRTKHITSSSLSSSMDSKDIIKNIKDPIHKNPSPLSSSHEIIEDPSSFNTSTSTTSTTTSFSTTSTKDELSSDRKLQLWERNLKLRESNFYTKQMEQQKKIQSLEKTVLSLRLQLAQVSRLDLRRYIELEQISHEKILKIQKIFRDWLFRNRIKFLLEKNVSEDVLKVSRDRFKAMKEIIDTERVFVNNLEECISCYLEPIRQQFKVPKELDELFGELFVVSKLSKNFLNQLEKVFLKWPNACHLGPVFIQMAPVMTLYFGYIKVYDSARESLLKYKKNNHNFVLFLEKCTKQKLSSSGNSIPYTQSSPIVPSVPPLQIPNPNNTIDFNSYLIMPVQRLPRYKLLLKALLDKTPQYHSDYSNLSIALNKVTDIIADIEFKSQKISHKDSPQMHSSPTQHTSNDPMANYEMNRRSTLCLFNESDISGSQKSLNREKAQFFSSPRTESNSQSPETTPRTSDSYSTSEEYWDSDTLDQYSVTSDPSINSETTNKKEFRASRIFSRTPTMKIKDGLRRPTAASPTSRSKIGLNQSLSNVQNSPGSRRTVMIPQLTRKGSDILHPEQFRDFS